MAVMAFLGIISILSFLVFLGIMIFSFIKKKSKKTSLIGMALSFVVLIAAAALTPSTPNDTISQSPAIASAAPTEIRESAAPAAPSSTAAAQTPPLIIHYLNVGQGDSEFIELPNGQTALIDAANSGDGANIAEYVKDKGYNRIDYLIATHPHADHIGGMADVINGLEIGAIYMPKAANSTQPFEELLNAVKAKGLSVNTAKGDVFLIDTAGLRLKMVAPISEKYDEQNDYSAVIKIVYKSNSFLFMGDAQAISEEEMLSAGIDVKADVLKVGHHGSDTSTAESFLKKVSPKYAIISVGADNSYGHPAQTTLDKLNATGSIIYRTDQDGTIIIKSDGIKLSVSKNDFATEGWLNAGNSETASPSLTPSSTAPSASGTEGKGKIIISDVDKEAEIVTIKNTGSNDINIKGWVLVSVKGNQRFTFQSYNLKAGDSATIASGKSTGDLKWTSKNVWNNDTSDPAELYDSAGNLVSSYGS
jgi:beta-lactamase superfamily II metal-dependent hydrolase